MYNIKFVQTCGLLYTEFTVWFDIVLFPFQDRDSKFRLILVESRIHRLARYYKTRKVLAPNWKYESSTASALVA